MSDGLLERVAASGLLPAGEAVVVLLSGGRDSVCLLDVAVELGASVRALHVNYGLRDDAGEDEALCADLCARLGVELAVRRPQRPEKSEAVNGGRTKPLGVMGEGRTPEPRNNVQAWARDVRYAEAARYGCAVAAAHTVTDQAETVLYRLAASPGRRALLGLPARSGRLVRPLLAAGVTREETGARCVARGLAWRDDPSNETDRFARGRVRARLVPALREIHPAAEANVLRTAALLRDEKAVLDEVVSTALAGRDRIARDKLASLPRALARLVLVRLAEDATGDLVPAAAERLDDVLAAPDRAAIACEGGADLVVEGAWVAARAHGPAAAPVPVAGGAHGPRAGPLRGRAPPPP